MAQPTSSSDAADPSTPTTTGPSAAPCARTTMTGQCACEATWDTVDPRIAEESALWPRDPITTMTAVHPTWNGLDDRRFRWLHIVARLAPGLDHAAAKAALDVRYRQILEHELTAVPAFAALSDRFKADYRTKTLVLSDASRGISEIRGALGTPVLLLMVNLAASAPPPLTTGTML